MSNTTTCALGAAFGILLCAAGAHAQQVVINGGFEAGFTGWTRADQLGSDGAFHLQSGTLSPTNGFVVPAPVEALSAAMTDSVAGGSHALYQDIVIPAGATGGSFSASVFISNAAGAFFTPAHLDWAGTALNQQARIDLISTSADPFSIASADVLMNLFSTPIGSPTVTGYNTLNIDVSAVVAAFAGQTVRLRFAEVDNVNFFNFGVDAVSLTIVPTPAGVLAILVGLPGVVRRRV